jgi:hypothetical protein
MWKNTLENDRPQMTKYYGACAVHAGQLSLQTHRIYNTYCFSTVTIFTRTRLTLRYTYIPSIFNTDTFHRGMLVMTQEEVAAPGLITRSVEVAAQ